MLLTALTICQMRVPLSIATSDEDTSNGKAFAYVGFFAELRSLERASIDRLRSCSDIRPRSYLERCFPVRIFASAIDALGPRNLCTARSRFRIPRGWRGSGRSREEIRPDCHGGRVADEFRPKRPKRKNSTTRTQSPS